MFVGVDCHKDTLAVCVVDSLGEPVAEHEFGNDLEGHRALLGWTLGVGKPRRFGVEGAGGYGLVLARFLAAAGQAVVEVPTALTAGERPRTGRRGKTDAADALAIARVLLRKKPLPQIREDGRSSDLKILSDYRDQLQQERTRIGNRLHADLMVLCPGYQHTIRRLTSQTSLESVAARLKHDRTVRARIARRRLAELRRLDTEISSVKREMVALLNESGTGLTQITGVGTLIAARIIGEVGDVRRFPSKGHFASANGTAPIPASSGRTDRHRLNRGGLRKLNWAIHTMALTQARSDPRGREYIERRRAEGKTWREAMRCLKRHLSNVVYRQLLVDADKLKLLAA